MAYNDKITRRIHSFTADWAGINEKKMFGGVGFMLNGNMCCGVYKDSLILRLKETDASDLLNHSFARPFDITGRPMRGWVMIDPSGLNDRQFANLLNMSKKFVDKMPAK